jgi:hypothetical protein
MLRDLMQLLVRGLRGVATPEPAPGAVEIQEAIASIEDALVRIRRNRGLTGPT